MANSEDPTAGIIKALNEGRDREENFRRLFERYYAQLYRFFRRKGMSPEDCEGLAQETFISVHKGLKALRQGDQFEGWLYAIALNAYRSEIERRLAAKRTSSQVSLEGELNRSEDVGQAASLTADPGANPMEALLDKEKKGKLREALQELPEQMRRCVQLRVVNDLSYQEISVVMGISINTVKSHLHQARKVLGEKLSPYFYKVEV